MFSFISFVERSDGYGKHVPLAFYWSFSGKKVIVLVHAESCLKPVIVVVIAAVQAVDLLIGIGNCAFEPKNFSEIAVSIALRYGYIWALPEQLCKNMVKKQI